MSAWDEYVARMELRGTSRRDVAKRREMRYLSTKLPNTLSYHIALIDDVQTDVAVIDTDNFNEKLIFSMPGEDIKHGAYVEWMDNHWLVTERDANVELRTKAKMIQCNHLLKWIDTCGEIHEQWCVVEDGTKYLTGEYGDRNYVITRGDSRIAVTIARNEDTLKFNRESRFLIDDPESEEQLSYVLSKPLKVGSIYNGDGVFKFVLQEVNSTSDDNKELGIADYYKHYPKPEFPYTEPKFGIPTNNYDENGRKVWM